MYIDNSQQLTFKLLKNDGTPTSCMRLIVFKTIISKALPNMDKTHIIRLLFDARHESLVAYEGQDVIGGACFAIFEPEKFAELAFLAVKADKRIQGYGKKIMNKLKSTLQQRKLKYMITYGDNMALGFFRKQGFSQKITMSPETWEGYIKQYDGGKLMECKIHQNVDYINIDKIIQIQKAFVIDTIKRNSLNQTKFQTDRINKGCDGGLIRKLPDEKYETFLRDPRIIPGVIQSGWSWQEYDLISKSQIEPFHLRCKKLIQSIKKHPQSKYFLEPVSVKQVPTYRKVIKNPMDFQTMMEKLQRHEYKNEEHFCQDIQLIFENCKQFNHPDSVYYKSGERLKELIKSEVEAFKHAVICVSSGTEGKIK